eukprot:jgi/Psemu1/306263/fgenesh1_kg.245_\
MKIPTVLSFRISTLWNKNKKRYLSIIAAAIIATSAFPHRVTANTATNAGILTNDAAVISRTVLKSPNDIDDENIPSDDYEYVTTADDCPSARPVIEDASQIIATGLKQPPTGDLMVLNDIMVKKGLRNIAVVGGGVVTLPFLKKKIYATYSDENSDVDNERVQDGYDETIQLDCGEKTVSPVVHVAKKECLPLSDPKYIKARAQPKSRNEEAALATRYSAIPTVEERSYQILIDLGMIEVTN